MPLSQCQAGGATVQTDARADIAKDMPSLKKHTKVTEGPCARIGVIRIRHAETVHEDKRAVGARRLTRVEAASAEKNSSSRLPFFAGNLGYISPGNLANFHPLCKYNTPSPTVMNLVDLSTMLAILTLANLVGYQGFSA